MMDEYWSVSTGSDRVSVSMYVGSGWPRNLSQRMEDFNPRVYMNGRNWSVLLRYYLSASNPRKLDSLRDDSEGSTCCLYYPLTPEYEKAADRLAWDLNNLIGEGERIYRFFREHSHEIEWD